VIRLLVRLTVSLGLVVGLWTLLWAPLAIGEATEPSGERVLGSPDAPVTIVEYASLTCPACADFHVNTLPDLKERYIDTGKVRLVYRDFPLDAAALAASAIALCAPEPQFFRFIDVFYRNQQRWRGASDAGPAQATLTELGLPEAWAAGGFAPEVVRGLMSEAAPIAALIRLAHSGGLKPESSAACLADLDLIEQVLASRLEGAQQGVNSTPSFIVEGRLLAGTRGIDAFAEILDPLLDGS
jgi:protein-disulfide isomerase